MKIFQINTTLNSSAPGRIAEEIGKVLLAKGHESYIGYGRRLRPSASWSIKIGSPMDQAIHGLKTRILDLHGFGSSSATARFIEQVKRIDPDIIHLHNIHGYYLNVDVFFSYLKASGKPVVWTLHDCWPFTGHCSHFDFVNCDKWKTQCFSCPNKMVYPKSLFLDNSRNNYLRKREIFNGLDSLTIVTPSDWLNSISKGSFLKDYPVRTINNGIDLGVFQPLDVSNDVLEKYGISGKTIILGVANMWGKHKGLADFVQLSSMISESERIVLVGLNKKQLKGLPENITGISRTENVHDLAKLYSSADVFVNPTYVDNFPTTNLEALACGTPVITYNTGGSPEAIDDKTGIVVNKGDVSGLYNSIQMIISQGKYQYTLACRNRAEMLYDKNDRYNDYIMLFQEIIGSKQV